MTILTAPWPAVTLPLNMLQNEQIGYSDIPAVYAATLASLYGHIVGGETVGGTANPAPLNPSGDYGHDHSGGDFGAPLFRTVATCAAGRGNPSGGAGLITGYTASAMSLGADVDSTTTTSDVWAIPMWVPPCDPLNGAYLSLGVAIRVRLHQTSLLAGDTLTLEVWARNADDDQTADDAISFAVSSPQTTGLKQVTTSGTSTRLRLKQGAVNVLAVRAKVVRTTGGSSRSAVLWSEQAEIGIYEV